MLARAGAVASPCFARAALTLPSHGTAGELAHSRGAFWSLLAGVLALAILAQYALLIAGGARGAVHAAHDAVLHAKHSAAHYAHYTRSHVMHGGPTWAWTSPDTGHPAAAAAAAARAPLRRFAAAMPSWLGGGQQRWGPGAGYVLTSAREGEGWLRRVMWWRRRACAPPLKSACAAVRMLLHVRQR